MKNLTINENQPAIYITNLGKYTEGEHVGQWLNVPATKDQFNQALKNIGVDGVQYEEYFLTDWENIGGISQYSNIERINEMAKIQIAINEKLYNFFGADHEITYFNDDKYKVMEILNDYAKEQADELTTDEIIENIESMRIFAQDQYNTCIVNFANYLIDELDYINFKEIEKVDQNIVNYFDFEKFGNDKLIELKANSDVIVGTYEVGKLNDTIIIVTLF